MAEVTFAGEQFRMAERVGLMPLMRFAKVAKSGVDSSDVVGLSAMYDLLHACIDPDDWPRFEEHADRTAADDDELMAVIAEVLKEMSGRPTSRSSVSSDGPLTVSTSSADASSSPAERLERQGRPDLALLVTQAQASRASA